MITFGLDRSRWLPPIAAAVALALWMAATGIAVNLQPAGESAGPARLSHSTELPVRFEANMGQARPSVAFIARSPEGATLLTRSGGLIVPGRRRPIQMRLHGANQDPGSHGAGRLQGRTNYLTGDDPRRWVTGVANFARVKYESVYPGIDLLYHESNGELEYDFLVSPGADPAAIAMSFGDSARLKTDPAGNLSVRTSGGGLTLRAPRIYQTIGGAQQRIPGGYRLGRAGVVEFGVGKYDPARRLVIDPVVIYSTYLGRGGDDVILGSDVDAAGNIYVAGETTSGDLPIKSAAQGDSAGPDAFVAKFNPLASGGDSLVYLTYLGGSRDDGARDVAVDTGGHAYVTGRTVSSNFPLRSPIQTFQDPGSCDLASIGCAGDAFVAELTTDGSGLVYSTHLGGSAADTGNSIAVDGAGNAYVAGETTSNNFPVPNAFDPCGLLCTDLNAFAARITPGGTLLAYSTYLRGSGPDRALGVAAEGGGPMVVTGSTASTDFPNTRGAQTSHGGGSSDTFVTRINSAASGANSLLYSSYLGGGADDSGQRVAVTGPGSAFVTGSTGTGGDVFVKQVNQASAGATATLGYSTSFGGSGSETGYDITFGQGSLFVTGSTNSPNFPMQNPAQGSSGGGTDAFLMQINPAASGLASLVFSTYLGGNGTDEGRGAQIHPLGDISVVGHSDSSNLPSPSALQAGNAGGRDGFVTFYGQPPVVSQVAPSSGPTAGGTNVTITGKGFHLGVSAVRFGGEPAAGYRVDSTSQITATSPAHGEGAFDVSVTTAAGTSAPSSGAVFTFIAPPPPPPPSPQPSPTGTAPRSPTPRVSLTPRPSISPTIIPSNKPGQITNLKAVAKSSTKVKLTFSAPGSSGQSPPPPRSYEIKQSKREIKNRRTYKKARSLCGGICTLSPKAVGAKLHVIVTNLNRNQTYYYVVRAQNVLGKKGPRSNVAKVRTKKKRRS